MPALERRDPLADEAIAALSKWPAVARHARIESALRGEDCRDVPELARLVAESARPAEWLDEAQLDQASRVFLRAGLLGGLTLALCSLVTGYAAPAGNKPLAFSGRLTEQADRRLAETAQFVTAVTQPGGLRPYELGFRLCLHVRLMHAQVRSLIDASGRWEASSWAEPINQHDMLATILLFSDVFVTGIRDLGVRVSDEEADAYQHLFRRVGELMGVEPELLPRSFSEADRMSTFFRLTQGRPDADSRELVAALLAGPIRAARNERERARAEIRVRIASGLCRSLVGDELADGLGLSRDAHRLWRRGVQSTFHLLERLRSSSSNLNDWVETLGGRYWQRSVQLGLGGRAARYELPHRLRDQRGSQESMRPLS